MRMGGEERVPPPQPESPLQTNFQDGESRSRERETNFSIQPRHFVKEVGGGQGGLMQGGGAGGGGFNTRPCTVHTLLDWVGSTVYCECIFYTSIYKYIKRKKSQINIFRSIFQKNYTLLMFFYIKNKNTFLSISIYQCTNTYPGRIYLKKFTPTPKLACYFSDRLQLKIKIAAAKWSLCLEHL